MHKISSEDRSIGGSASEWETGDFGQNTPFDREGLKETFNKANSAELIEIISKYISLSPGQFKIVCPFTDHKGGRESTPSFNIYPETNTFWCFGCKAGRKPVDFVSKIEGISKYQAALKIIESSEYDFVIDYDDSHNGKLKELMEFSEYLNIKSQIYGVDYMEKYSKIFDDLNKKYDLNTEATKVAISKIKELM